MLKENGHDVDLAENGQEAIACHADKIYDVILMDIQMPVLDGIEATKKIREAEGNQRHTPIIAITAYALQGDKEKFISMGMDDYLAKPIDMKQLMDKLDTVSRVRNECPTKISVNDRGEVCFEQGIGLIRADQSVIENLDRWTQELGTFFENNQSNNIEPLANKIKTACYSINADNMKNQAFKIELAVRRGNISEAKVSYEALKKECSLLTQ
jgi:CheY-like chemotaxis protein